MNLGRIDRYFMTKDAPLGKIRRFDLAKIKGLLFALGGAALLLILLIPQPDKKTMPASTSIDESTSLTTTSSHQNPRAAESGDFYVSNISGYSATGSYSSRSNRELSASQVVKQQGGGLGFGL
ncbi:MAG: hypothetical protein U1E10_10620, partial [Bdellovibrionales bacterium]|nr:hypothetical protein [Bdellovibrionales bacterium]